MSSTSGRVTLAFSCLGHAYMHFFTAFYFVIVLALEADWQRPYHELIELWTLGALLVGVGAIPAGWLSDRWSAAGMMIVMFLGLGVAGIVADVAWQLLQVAALQNTNVLVAFHRLPIAEDRHSLLCHRRCHNALDKRRHDGTGRIRIDFAVETLPSTDARTSVRVKSNSTAV